ncbi:hypothetical protein Poly30_40290 [Planctomycetes bacterium Poly30]|uniref:Tetratricopeptide repeat protein n=1 Tax=Saltatorellus ferox TaxID=2528018 RepID=A0A518EWL0_9BACT|nr:hypothetical protein Poly30_40290 [Planctomycetes bacterium Poly30]
MTISAHRLGLLATPFLLVAALSHAQDGQPAATPPQSTQPAGQPAGLPAAQRGGADPSDDAFKLGSPPALADGLTEEDMWPAATAEGWKEPCLVQWQRSFDDALAVARQRHMPVMVAVNMDGEIASEHFAGVRYRSPDTAELMSHYACVIASVYRHTPRDYDENGQRVPCPRFGTVTCGEHIQAERELYDRYFDGRRISPRHIVLDLEARETLDVFYSWDTQTVTNTFVKGVEGWPEPQPGPEPTLENLAQSHAVADREFLEQQYATGSREERRRILMALLEPVALDQVEVLRKAIFGLDLELARLARKALAECETEGALDLMAEVLKEPIKDEDRQMLLAAVERMSATSPRAKTLAALHSGLTLESKHLSMPAEETLAVAYESAARRAPSVDARAEAAEASPRDPAAVLGLAEAMLEQSLTAEKRYADLFADDARATAEEAASLNADPTRLAAVRAVLAWRSGDFRTARDQAVTAVENEYLLLRNTENEESQTPAIQERVLRLFADARRALIRRAYRQGQEWDPEWLSDLNAAYSILTRTGRIDDATMVDFYDFLAWIGATPRANEVLGDALKRFPDSSVAHERLRSKLLYEGGPEMLETWYGERLGRVETEASRGEHLAWFAGYASLVAAENHRRRSQFDEALASYARAIEHFDGHGIRVDSVEDDSAHYVALALAGRARVLMERGQLEGATGALMASLSRRPESAASLYGLGITPIATAKMLKAKWAEAGDAERAASVQTALEALDPKLLEPPANELPAARPRGGR